jgi:hypothetical protein
VDITWKVVLRTEIGLEILGDILKRHTISSNRRYCYTRSVTLNGWISIFILTDILYFM